MKISLILKKHTTKILFYLLEGDARFSELLSEVVPIRSTLSKSLMELLEDELIKRIVIESRPIQVKYTLTEKGKQVAKCLMELKIILSE